MNEAGDQHSSKHHVFNEWEGENGVTYRDTACRARYEKRSVGAVINHSARRGGDDLMKHGERTRLELKARAFGETF